MSQYKNTQKGPVQIILLVVAAIFIAVAMFVRGPVWFGSLFFFLGLLIVFLAFCFGRLTVCDEGRRVAVRYGPLPVFSKTIPYDQIKVVEATRSDWLDGGGIHYIPGRGWIYNLWGRDCVRLTLRNGVIRVGTDDVQGLVRFLTAKILQ